MTRSTTPVRTSDPETSYAAAVKAAEGAPKIRHVVRALVEEFGPLTQDELIGQYRKLEIFAPLTPKASDSGIRTRLSELRHQGDIVQDEEEGLSRFGNRAKRWITTEHAQLNASAQALYLSDDDPDSEHNDTEDNVGAFRG